MWAASSQHFNALLQLDPNNTQARIHRARAQYKLVSTLICFCREVLDWSVDIILLYYVLLLQPDQHAENAECMQQLTITA